jgi:hypothetical protein
MDGNITLTQQLKSNIPVVRNWVPYLEREHYTAYTEVLEDKMFIHLEVRGWSREVFEELREDLRLGLMDMEAQGYDIIFMTTEDPKSVKLWNAIKPCDELIELKTSAWLGAWYTGEWHWDLLK